MSFNCPECGRLVRVLDGDRRKRVQCPACQEVILVPRQPESRTSPRSQHADPRFAGAHLLRGRIYRWYSGLTRVRWGKL
jgi:hypothetical protein